MARFKDANWNLTADHTGRIDSWDGVKIAVLMDIRDELKKLNGLLHCSNFVAIPQILRDIKRGKCHRKHAAREHHGE